MAFKNHSRKSIVLGLGLVLAVGAFAVPAANAFAEPADSVEAPAAGVEAPGWQDGKLYINEANFPNANFREYLTTLKDVYNLESNHYFTKADISKITKIVASNRNITDFTGLSYFNELTSLDVQGNHLQQIDLAPFTELETVWVRNNELTSVDFSHNLKLKWIETFDNRLTKLDVSMLKDLEFLHADHNYLRVLDLSHNTKLQGEGFVARNNPTLEKIILPVIPGGSFPYMEINEQYQTGYKGYEWYYDAQFTEPVNTTQNIPFDGKTLYLKQIPYVYTVNFDTNGSTTHIDPYVGVTYGERIPLPDAPVPPKEGDVFEGWKDSVTGAVYQANYDGAINLAGQNQNKDAEVTLVAQWGSKAEHPPVTVDPGDTTPVEPGESPKPENPNDGGSLPSGETQPGNSDEDNKDKQPGSTEENKPEVTPSDNEGNNTGESGTAGNPDKETQTGSDKNDAGVGTEDPGKNDANVGTENPGKQDASSGTEEPGKAEAGVGTETPGKTDAGTGTNAPDKEDTSVGTDNNKADAGVGTDTGNVDAGSQSDDQKPADKVDASSQTDNTSDKEKAPAVKDKTVKSAARTQKKTLPATADASIAGMFATMVAGAVSLGGAVFARKRK